MTPTTQREASQRAKAFVRALIDEAGDEPRAELLSFIAALEAERDRYFAALQEISQGAGRFSVDPLTHASNTIEDMKQLASDALAASQAGASQ